MVCVQFVYIISLDIALNLAFNYHIKFTTFLDVAKSDRM